MLQNVKIGDNYAYMACGRIVQSQCLTKQPWSPSRCVFPPEFGDRQFCETLRFLASVEADPGGGALCTGSGSAGASVAAVFDGGHEGFHGRIVFDVEV